jgi:superoxide dismutase
MTTKDKTFTNKFSNMRIEVYGTGWTILENDNEHTIVLGNYPNARWELIEKALEYVKKLKQLEKKNAS